MKKNVIDLSLAKSDMKITLKLKVAPEIEDYFRRASIKAFDSANTEVSRKWLNSDGRGLHFYKKNEQLSNKVTGQTNIMDNFGNGLLDDGKVNLALLRVVGITDGVTVSTEDLLGYEDMKEYIERLGLWTKAFYEERLNDQNLSASIQFEL